MIKQFGIFSKRCSLIYSLLLAVGLPFCFAAQHKISLKRQQAPLSEVFKEIQRQSGLTVFFSNDLLDARKAVSVNFRETPLESAMDYLLEGTSVSWQLQGKYIVLRKRTGPSSKEQESVSTMVSEQEERVSGTVIDPEGKPMEGVSIRVKGTQLSTATDASGKFTLIVADLETVLEVSYVGYEFLEVPLAGSRSVNIQLEPLVGNLEEVVVVGYGTMQKSDLTGSVTMVDQTNIKQMPAATIDQKLVGQVAGVQIQQVTGAPGGGTSVKIRGAGSIGAGNEPLYVIDGMPYASGMNQNLNPLVFLNPNDIESISVLKDASSTAIYGSRGANGVIMITTKKGSYDRTEVSVSATSGIQQVPQRGRPSMMNSQEFADYQREKIAGMIWKNEKREATDSDYPAAYLPQNISGEGTDWYDLILQTAQVQDYSVSVNKGSKESRLNFSLGYYNQEGVVRYTGLERFTGNLSMESNIGSKVKLGATLQPTYIHHQQTNTNSGRGDVIGFASWGNPILSPYDDQGQLIPYIVSPQNKYYSSWSFVNPLFMLRETVRNRNNFQNLGSAFLEWNVIDGLKLRSAISTNYSANKFFLYQPSTIGGQNSAPKPGTGVSNTTRGDAFDWLIENTANYDRTFGDAHRLNILLGYTTQKSKGDNIDLQGNPYANDLIETINAAQGIKAWGQNINEWTMISYLGRLNYTLKDRYLLTATFRSDGSSRFGSENRFAFFPSVAGAWRLSEEDFLSDSHWIDELKLRISYGRSGNNNIGNYAHLPAINAGSYVFGDRQVTASSVGISNPFLTWEESSQIDGGVDLTTFGNRLSLVVDYYYRKSVNMLLNDVIPAITGFNNQIVNKGNVRNTGVEVALNAVPVEGKLRWETTLNFALNRNKVISLNDNGDPIYSGNSDDNYTHITQVGGPIGQFFGYVFDGLYSAEDAANPNVVRDPSVEVYEGGVKYKDLDGDGLVNDLLDYAIIGNPQPDFIFGFSNRLTYRQFDLSAVINGQYGGSVMNGLRQTIDNLQGQFNVGKEWVARYRSADDPGDGRHYAVPFSAPSRGHRVSDLWVEDASYLRITNLTLGYGLPEALVSRSSFIKSCRVYITVQNLATFTSYSGANPEGQSVSLSNTLAPGFDISSYPLARTASFGINLTF